METTWAYRVKHLPHEIGGETGFYSPQTTYLSMKVLTLAKNLNQIL